MKKYADMGLKLHKSQSIVRKVHDILLGLSEPLSSDFKITTKYVNMATKVCSYFKYDSESSLNFDITWLSPNFKN